MNAPPEIKPILVLGASGYIGTQLVRRLLDLGYPVRAGGRFPEKLKRHAWAADPRVNLTRADALDRASLAAACHGCSAVYYLVHSMNPQQKDFAAADREAASNMAAAAEKNGIERLIYLGGMGGKDPELSKHLRSRLEVEQILASGAVPVTTLRAAMIIGKGSVSFEILRALVKRLPVMVTPRWVNTESQPIAADNILTYLTGCLTEPTTIGQGFDVGGPDIVSYRELMIIYAEEAGVPKRILIPIPVLTPRLSSLWIGLVTPYPSYIARPLAEGLRNRIVCMDNRITTIIPQELLTCRQAIRAALVKDGR